MASVAKKILFSETGVTASATGTKDTLQTRWKDLIAFIKVSNYTDGTFTAKIEHSPNGVDWFDLVSFTAALAANTVELQFPSTAVLGHIRADVVVGGAPATGADISIEVDYDEAR